MHVVSAQFLHVAQTMVLWMVMVFPLISSAGEASWPGLSPSDLCYRLARDGKRVNQQTCKSECESYNSRIPTDPAGADEETTMKEILFWTNGSKKKAFEDKSEAVREKYEKAFWYGYHLTHKSKEEKPSWYVGDNSTTTKAEWYNGQPDKNEGNVEECVTVLHLEDDVRRLNNDRCDNERWCICQSECKAPPDIAGANKHCDLASCNYTCQAGYELEGGRATVYCSCNDTYLNLPKCVKSNEPGGLKRTTKGTNSSTNAETTEPDDNEAGFPWTATIAVTASSLILIVAIGPTVVFLVYRRRRYRATRTKDVVESEARIESGLTSDQSKVVE